MTGKFVDAEAWRCLGAVDFLTRLFITNLESEGKRSVLVLVFKNKGDVQSCSNYRGTRLMCLNRDAIRRNSSS